MTTQEIQGAQPAHTPGPWEVTHSGNKDDFRGQWTWINAEGGTVAQVFPCGNPQRAFKSPELSDLPEPSNGRIGQANARLIAAAPELLEALEDCCKALPTKAPEYKRAMEAIAKATGAQA